MTRNLKKDTLGRSVIRNSKLSDIPIGQTLNEMYQSYDKNVQKKKKDLATLKKRDKLFQELIDEYKEDRKAFIERYS